MVIEVCKMGKYEMLDQHHDSLGVLLELFKECCINMRKCKIKFDHGDTQKTVKIQ